jgi:hypothetical protein
VSHGRLLGNDAPQSDLSLLPLGAHIPPGLECGNELAASCLFHGTSDDGFHSWLELFVD